MKPELVRKAESLGIPLTQKTEHGEAKLASIEINELGVSAGYIIPGEVHEIEIKGTLTFEQECPGCELPLCPECGNCHTFSCPTKTEDF